MKNQNSIWKMLTLCSGYLVFLGLFHFSGAITYPNVSSTLLYIEDTMYYIENTKPKHWYGARSACESMGYNLVSFNTPNKYNAIKWYLDDQEDINHYWTSGNDFMMPGRHVWLPSGKPVASYLWYSGEPNNLTGVEHCDEIYKSKMYVQDCTLKHCYICERFLK